MYNDFYDFDKKPFPLNPESNFLFLGQKHKAILSNLKTGLSNQYSLMVVTGNTGSGKSVLAHSLLNQLDPDYTAALLTTQEYKSLEEMLTNIFIAFNLKPHSNNSTELSTLLFENFLTTEFWNEKKVLLIVDEAQNLSVDLLESIRLLSNFTINNKQIIQFILVGQKRLIDNLKIPELGQLINSVSLFEDLPPLNLDETKQYVLQRLQITDADTNNTPFTQKAYDSIYEFSGGIPSLIDHLCDSSFVAALAEKINPIDSDLIEAIANGKKINSKNIEQLANETKHTIIEDIDAKPSPIKDQALADLEADEIIVDLIPDQEENNITSKEENQYSQETASEKKATAKTESKVPSKWLISILALLCIVNAALFFYTKNATSLNETITPTPKNKTSTQNSHSKPDSIINADSQLPTGIAIKIDSSKSGKQADPKTPKILLTNQDQPAPGIATSSTGQISNSPEPEPLETKTAEEIIKQNKQIKKLLFLAEKQFSHDNLTSPENYNATQTYKKILEFDPQYEPALAGLKKIKDLYIMWARTNIRKKNFNRAEKFINKAIIVDPEDTNLHIILDSVQQNSASIY